MIATFLLKSLVIAYRVYLRFLRSLSSLELIGLFAAASCGQLTSVRDDVLQLCLRTSPRDSFADAEFHTRHAFLFHGMALHCF